MRSSGLFLLSFMLWPFSLFATVSLPNVLSDHAVLQRERPVRVWGWADPSEQVSVQFHRQSVGTRADAFGLWEVWLKPERAGGPYTLTVAGDATPVPLQRKDILVGDVWIASGQSNMEFPLKGFTGAPLKDGEAELARANHSNIRLLLQRRRTAADVLFDTEDTWAECTSESAKNFSAVAYFFGRELAEKEKVPIGLIDSTWGGTPADAWISGEGIAAAHLSFVATDAGKVAREQGMADQLKSLYRTKAEALKHAGLPVPARPRIPNDHDGSWAPATLYNAMIAPYTKYAIKGVIWYQGETDATAERALNYKRVFAALIEDWRQQWAQGDFPFLFAQISSFGSGTNWPTVRDAQRRTLAVSNTAMAVTLDVGLPDNVHPPDKQTVAARLARSARALVYGESIESSSPVYLQATTEGPAMRVWFSHAEGLTSKGQPLDGFELAGEDERFVPASGSIEGSTILVRAPSVASPRYVRYAWSGTVKSYFYNGSGLPAGSFTSQ